MPSQLLVELSDDRWMGGLQLAIERTDEVGGDRRVCDVHVDPRAALEIVRLLDGTERSTAGVERIGAERLRQLGAEGWTPEHDERHANGELAAAAACYAIPPGHLLEGGPAGGEASARWVPELWPFAAEAWKPTPGNRIRELVKAGALIAAEIDRLLRAAGEA